MGRIQRKFSAVALALWMSIAQVFASGIGSINGLTSLGNGVYGINFKDSSSGNGYITTQNDIVADRWYSSYEFKIANDFDWGSTTYDGVDHFLGNIKIYRLWNPATTPENVVLAFQGWDNNCILTIEGIPIDSQGRLKSFYFFDNYKTLITKEVWHRLEFESKSGTNNDGYVKVWFDGKQILDTGGITTRKNSGQPRPFIGGGWANVWSTGNHTGDNNFMIRNVVNLENKTRADMAGVPAPQPTPTPTPTPTPVPAPTTAPSLIPQWFKDFVIKLVDFIKGLVA